MTEHVEVLSRTEEPIAVSSELIQRCWIETEETFSHYPRLESDGVFLSIVMPDGYVFRRLLSDVREISAVTV